MGGTQSHRTYPGAHGAFARGPARAVAAAGRRHQAHHQGRLDSALRQQASVLGGAFLRAAVVAAVLLTTLAYLQWVERKVIAHIQVRMGPSRVGPHGLLQPLADVIKLITKEDLIPPYVNKLLYLGAPFFAITMALLSI